MSRAAELHGAGRRGFICAVIAAAVMQMSGCLIIPTPEHGLLAGRGQIDKKATEFLVPGATTVEQVLLHFGEPDATLNDQRIFVYHWTVVSAYIFIGYGYGGDGGPIGKDYMMLLSFDESSRLERFKRVTPGWFESIDKRVRRWIDELDVRRPADSEPAGRSPA